ncbi:MAG: hypothetical protein ACRBBP_05625 [Bdellovibrionales bacterium]
MLLLILGSSSTAFTEQLSEVELFYRCYAHLTSSRVYRSHPLLKSVKAGEISAENACLQTLAKAKLKTNGRLQNINDEEAKAVLKSFTKLHMTFFSRQSLVGASGVRSRIMNDIYDEQSSAHFYTRALLKNNDIDSVLKGKKDLEGIRSNRAPANVGYSSNMEKSLFTYRDGSTKVPFDDISFVETGDLVGLKAARVLSLPNMNRYTEGSKDLLASIGGGVLGARSYLLRSLPAVNVAASDGADKMNRSWANTVLSDFLCKSLPAVRLTDGQPYKKRNATSAFRKSDGCIQCHATMDQLAAGGRGFLMNNITTGNVSATNPQFKYPYQRKVTKGNAPHWPETTDASYALRPPKGALYYRSYNGDLVHKPFSNLEGLANNILETNDYYSCVAKKYYEHFTGVDVSLADIQDPFSLVQLNEQDLFHRNKVIELGQELKKTKNTYGLVEAILKSKVYQSEGYTLLGGN